MSSIDDLDRFAESLREKGETGLRLRAVETARQFKRSWLEMARVILEVRNRRSYESWGYPDVYAYCLEELRIKRPTVEKLVLSYSTISEHAPKVLNYDGVAQPIPSVDSVDYLAKALRERDTEEDGSGLPSEDVIAELKQAIFEEGAPVQSLRKRFDPIIHPKSEAEIERDAIKKALGALRRLEATLLDVTLEMELFEESRSLFERLHRALEQADEDAKEARELAS